MLWTVLTILGWGLTLVHAADVPDAQQLLNLHNYYRSQHGAAPLAWSPALVASADRYARRCIWAHSSSAERNGAGENLYFSMGMDVPTIGARASRDWYSEVNDYNFNSPGNAKRWGAMIGHFTAMVWKDTKEIGCAYVRCGWLAGYSNSDYVVCHYNPPGNWQDPALYAANVLPTGTPAPAVPKPVAAPAPRPAPRATRSPWDAAPACEGNPPDSTKGRDAQGRQWGFEKGVSCAYKKKRAAPVAKPSAPAAKGREAKDPWATAPPCPGRPTSSSATDKQGRKWGMANGVSCAYRQRSTTEASRKAAKPYTDAEANTPTPQPKQATTPTSTPAPSTTTTGGPAAAKTTWQKTGDPLVDAVPACVGVPTSENSVTDSKGRKWGMLDGKSCAFKAFGVASTTVAAATALAQG